MNTKPLDDSIKDHFRLFKASKIEKNVKQKARYDVVLLYMERYTQKEISQVLHIPRRTVSYHIASYKKGGLERGKNFRMHRRRSSFLSFPPRLRKRPVWVSLPTGLPPLPVLL